MIIYLNGIVRCGHCNSNMTIKIDSRYKDDDTKISYICSRKNQINKNCENSVIRASIIEKAVFNELRKECKKIVFDEKELKEIFKTAETEINIEKYKIQAEINNIELKMEKLENQIKVIYEDKLNGILLPDDFLQIYKIKNEEKEKLINEKTELQQQLEEQEKTQMLDGKELKQFADDFLQMENPTKEIIRNLIDEIIISKGRKIKIKYKFSKV